MKASHTRCVAVLICLLSLLPQAHAEDSEVARQTLKGLAGVRVLVENMQPNIQPHAQKAGITAVGLQQAIENRLHAVGIRTLSGNDWLKVAGRPVLYVNVNTHETQKYWYAYDIKVELRQVVRLEADPKVQALADTWSIHMTGMADIGDLSNIKDNTMALVERFVQAYESVNKED